MKRPHIFFIAAFSIRLVTALPQSSLDWNFMNSPDLLAYDTSSLASTTSSDSSDLFSSDSFLPMDNPSVDWNSYDLSSVPLDLGASPETFTSSDDTLWDDSSYSLPPDVIATGCSGTFGKREEGASCSTTREEDPCDPDKEAMCCTPSWMMRSRWAGGGFNMDGCVQLVEAGACISSGGSVQCCIRQVNLMNTNRMGCTTSTKVPGNSQPNAPQPNTPQQPTYPKNPNTPEVPDWQPAPDLQPEIPPSIPLGNGF